MERRLKRAWITLLFIDIWGDFSQHQLLPDLRCRQHMGHKKLLCYLKQPSLNTFIFALHVHMVIIGIASAVLKGYVKLL